MAKSKRSKKSKSEQLSETLRLRIICICFIFLIVIAAMRLGPVGEGIDFAFCFLFGNFNGIIYFILLLLLGYIFYVAKLPHFTGPLAVGGYLILIALLTFAAAPSDKEIKGILVLQQYLGHAEVLKGGVIGAMFFSVFSFLFDRTGAFIAALVVGIIGVVLIGSKSYVKWMRPKKKKKASKPRVNEDSEEMNQKTGFIDFFSKKKTSSKPFFPERVFDDRTKRTEVSSKEKATFDDIHEEVLPIEEPHFQIHEEKVDHDTKEVDSEPIVMEEKESIKEEDLPKETKEEIKTSKEVKINKNYKLPPLSLLKSTVNKKNGNARAIALDNAKKLTAVLKEFGVNATVHDIFIGPAVTKYEIKIETGVRVNRIVSLQDDIKLALAAKDIRIEAPIPGKSAIGIEIPNLEASTVSFKEVFKDIPENKKDSKLLIPLGKDITGHSIYAEINKMPHLLIAGATGSGKSVCVNTIICSILMRAKPDEVKLLLVDPKKVELTGYNGIPHLIGPVVTDPKKAAAALRKVVEEMERRYELFAKTNARNIEGYNEHAKNFNETNASEEVMEILPYYVVILDEVADLMMVASKEVEDCIMRISQMARAAGIHLIVATQRPSTDVITGVIKANIPSRIAFAVSSSIDSRTILDASGAEKLLGRGDMLFSPIGSSHPTRVQGAFVSDDEVSALVHYVMTQQEASYDENFVNLKSLTSVGSNYEEEDEEYEMCRDFVIREQKASASLLQRQFRIGYNKAARIIDQLEANGVIGPQLGSKPREVLIRGYHEEDL